MIQPRRQLRAQFLMLGHEFLRNILQRLQMARRIAIPERMIRDEIKAALEKNTKMVEIGHAASMARWRTVGKVREVVRIGAHASRVLASASR